MPGRGVLSVRATGPWRTRPLAALWRGWAQSCWQPQRGWLRHAGWWTGWPRWQRAHLRAPPGHARERHAESRRVIGKVYRALSQSAMAVAQAARLRGPAGYVRMWSTGHPVRSGFTRGHSKPSCMECCACLAAIGTAGMNGSMLCCDGYPPPTARLHLCALLQDCQGILLATAETAVALCSLPRRG